MKTLGFDRFQVIRLLNRDQFGYTAVAIDQLDTECPSVVLKMSRVPSIHANRSLLISYYSWLQQLQPVPNIAALTKVGIGSDHNLYQVRPYYDALDARHLNPLDIVRHLVTAVSFFKKHNRLHHRIRLGNILYTGTAILLSDPMPLPRISSRTTEDIHFNAPEVLLKGTYDSAAELYSLGVALFRLLTGQYLFDDTDPATLESKCVLAAPRPLACDLPDEIATLIERLVSKTPETRLAAFERLEQVVEVKHTGRRTSIIGRDSEIRALQDHLAADTHSLSVIYIEGARGIGKTTLLRDIGRRCAFLHPPYDFIYFDCHADTAFDDFVRSTLAGLVTTHLLHHEGSYERVLGPYRQTLEGFLWPDRTADGTPPSTPRPHDIVGLLARLSTFKRIVFAVDDIHDVPEHVDAFLQHVAARTSEFKGHLLLTGVSAGNQDSFAIRLVAQHSICNFRLLGLQPLTRESSNRIQSELGLTAEVTIIDPSEGNPFFIFNGSSDDATNGQGKIQSWLSSSLRWLTADALRLVQILCLFGTAVAQNVVRHALKISPERFDLALSVARATNLVGGHSHISFYHSRWLQPLVYKSIPVKQRSALHEDAFRTLRGFASPELLAYHARRGKLYHDAFELYRTEGKAAKERGEHLKCVSLYRFAERMSRKVGRTLSGRELISLADAYLEIGHRRTAINRYNQLLRSDCLSADPALAGILFRRLASRGLVPYAERLRLLAKSLQCLSSNSVELTRTYESMIVPLVMLGRFGGASRVLDRLKRRSHTSSQRRRITLLRALFYLHSGEFGKALALLDDARSQPISARTIDLEGNRAFCLEHLGQLQLAHDVLVDINSLTKTSGSAYGRILSLNNLGSVLVKMGRLADAKIASDQASELLHQYRWSDRSFRINNIPIVMSDIGRCSLKSGSYGTAVRIFERLRTCKGSGELDSMSAGLAAAEFWMQIGDRSRCQRIINRLRTRPLARRGYFGIELDLAEIEAMPNICELARARVEALEGHVLITISGYQKARIHCLLSLASGYRVKDARRHANEALRVSSRNGYRPLEAKAMFARGLASEEFREKEVWLNRAYRAAVDIGLPELAAESTYRLGILMLEGGRTARARDYLLKSTTTTAELCERLPARYRAKYLDEEWRRDARKRLYECANAVVVERGSETGTGEGGGDPLFRTLYRISVAASEAAELDTFVTSVSLALEKLSFVRFAVIMLKCADETLWNSLRSGVPDELKNQIGAIAKSAQKGTRFDSLRHKLAHEGIMWIPFDSQNASGGIYLVRDNSAPPLSEGEIEFGSMLGSLMSSAIDRIRLRPSRSPMGRRIGGSQAAALGIVGSSRAIREVISQVELAASNTASVLIEGETGTGKELVAKAIHMAGSRAHAPFVAIDCGALPETLIESELFGAVKGAYTGAVMDRPGLFESAHRGSLFLDEIGNMSPSLQVKLLRVLQEREIRRIGDTQVRPIDVRVMAATNRSLNAAAEAGLFRQDLLYRINVLHLTLPPLRERRGDIPVLAEHFLDLLNKKYKSRKRFGPEAFESVAAHRFPGNVRELQNVVERAYLSETESTIHTILPDAKRREESVKGFPVDDVLTAWFHDLTEGRRDFWTAVHDRYRRRDISRETLVALLDLGLRQTRGSYRKLASLFRLEPSDYRRMMSFLRRSHCLLDFRPYRKTAVSP
jgi:transcriptional regulator with GAF, ATPase, and Fis domain/tetratricopeptide (TPR) repeat protein